MNQLEHLKAAARKKLAPNVTYIDPKFKEVASWAEELLNAFWVEQQKDLDTLIEHTHTVAYKEGFEDGCADGLEEGKQTTIQSVRERIEATSEFDTGLAIDPSPNFLIGAQMMKAKILKDLEAPVEGEGV